MKKIAFVCTGNTCRSPMAENIFRHLLDKNSVNGYTVSSFGTAVAEGDGMHPFAYKALVFLGIEPKPHIATQATKPLIDDCDFVVALTGAHLARLDYPTNAATLDALTGCGDIADPYGGAADIYFACAKELYSALTKLLEALPKLLK